MGGRKGFCAPSSQTRPRSTSPCGSVPLACPCRTRRAAPPCRAPPGQHQRQATHVGVDLEPQLAARRTACKRDALGPVAGACAAQGPGQAERAGCRSCMSQHALEGCAGAASEDDGCLAGAGEQSHGNSIAHHQHQHCGLPVTCP